MQFINTKIVNFVKKTSPANRIYLLALPPCVLALLLYLMVWHQPQPFPDSGDYLALSRSIASQGQYMLDANDKDGLNALMRTPGYPVFIALGRLVVGEHGFFLVNLLFLYGLCVMTLRLAAEWKIGKPWIVALLLATAPALIVTSTTALSEVPFAFWCLTGLYLLKRDRLPSAGLCLSVATLIRPAGIYLFIPLALWLLWQHKKWYYVLLFAAAANLLPIAWSARNYAKTGYFTYTTMDGFYMLNYKAGSYLSWKENVPFAEMCTRLNSRIQADNPIEHSRKSYILGKQIIRENLVGFMLWAPRNLPYFLMPDINPLLERLNMVSGNRGTLDILRRQGMTAAFKHYFSGNPGAAVAALGYTAFFALSWLLFPLGIWALIRRKRYEFLSLSLLCIAYFWVLPTGNLDWRFRIPALPLIFIIFSSGALYIYEASQRFRNNKKGVVIK